MGLREDYLDYIDTYYGYAYTYFELAKDDIWLAKQKFGVWSDHNVLGTLIDGCYYLYTAVGALTMFDEPIGGRARIPHFLRFYTIDKAPKVTVTWQAICEAWVKDDFEARFWTIGIIDRMRQIMWDEPFDLTWAARPERKEIPSE